MARVRPASRREKKEENPFDYLEETQSLRKVFACCQEILMMAKLDSLAILFCIL